jgi:hypothetical protein
VWAVTTRTSRFDNLSSSSFNSIQRSGARRRAASSCTGVAACLRRKGAATIGSSCVAQKRCLVLGGRSTVGHGALDAVIGVRIPASQPDSFGLRPHSPAVRPIQAHRDSPSAHREWARIPASQPSSGSRRQFPPLALVFRILPTVSATPVVLGESGFLSDTKLSWAGRSIAPQI